MIFGVNIETNIFVYLAHFVCSKHVPPKRNSGCNHR